MLWFVNRLKISLKVFNLYRLTSAVVLSTLYAIAGQAQAPVITSLDPPAAQAGSAALTVTVSGQNFTNTSSVRWNGQNLQTTFLSLSVLKATIPVSDLAGFATALITVFNGQISNGLAFTVYRAPAVTTNDIIYEPVSRRIYASQPGSMPGGNSVTWLDPSSGAQGSSVFVGSEPGKLAVSDDGQQLYIALNGAAAVRRFDLGSQTAGLQFWLGSDPFYGPSYVEDMKVLPGGPSALAVAKINVVTAGVAIYDDGVQRPAEVSGQAGVTRLAFSSSSSVLYGYADGLNAIQTMSVDTSGVTLTNTATNFVLGGPDMKFDNGRIYSTFGTVIDASTMTTLGTFSAPDLSASAVVPDSGLGRVFFLSLNGTTAVIHVFNALDFSLVGRINIPGIAGGSVSSMVRWGDDGLAFRDSNQVFMVRVPSPWFTSGPQLTVSPGGLFFPAQALDTTSASIAVIVSNNTNGSIAITSIGVTGDFSQTNNCTATLAASASCSINVTFTPAMEGTRTGVLTIVDGSNGSPHVAGMSGIGVASNPLPSITTIAPVGAAAGASQLTLTVSGGNFVPASVVRWNGANLPTTFVNTGTVTATVSASNLAGLQSAAIAVFNPLPDGGLSNSATFTVYSSLPLTTKDLIYDASRRQIYASLPGSVAGGNSIIPVNPFTQTSGTSVFIGSEPGKLALSDDEHYLYVSLDGAAAVGRLDLVSQAPDLQFSLGVDPLYGPYYVNDMQVMPGSPSTVAVSRKFSGVSLSYGGVAVYDAGVKRMTDVQGVHNNNVIAFSGASTLYGSDLETSALAFQTMAVDSGGLTLGNSVALPVLDMTVAGGHVYSTTGAVVDPVNSNLLGFFTYDYHSTVSSIVADSNLNRVFLLVSSTSTSGPGILAFNQTDFTLIGSITIPIVESAASSLIRWGDDGLAFRNASGQLILLRIPPSWFTSGPAVTVSPASLAFPAQAVGTTSGSEVVTITNNTNAAIAISSIAAGGDFMQTNTCGVTLPALSGCTINVTFRPAAAGLRAAALTIMDGSSGGPHVVGLSGIGNSSNPVPAIMSLSPTSAPVGSAQLTLTVTGVNFVSNSVVRWNGQNLSTTFGSSTGLTALIPSANFDGLDTAAITVFNPAPDGGPSNTAVFTVYNAITQLTKDLIYNSFDRRIYASVPGSVPNGNSIRPINPSTATLGTAVPIGSEPGKLAISDNGQYLYAGLDGAAAVRRFDLTSQTPGLQFGLGTDPLNGPYHALEIQVLPGSPSSVAVAAGALAGSSGPLAIYDNGIKRPTVPNTSSNVIAFSNSESLLYGTASQTFSTMAVDSTGITVTSSAPLAAGSPKDMKFDGEQIYLSSGAVIDAATVSIKAAFNMPTVTSPLSVVSDSTLNRVFFLSLSSVSSDAIIYAFDRSQFTLVGSMDIYANFGSSGLPVSSLVRWGDDGLAFRSDGGQVFLVRIPRSWLSSGPPLTVSPESLLFDAQPVGVPGSPQTVTLTNNTASAISITSIAAGGDFTSMNNCGAAIAALSTCSIGVTFTPSMQGTRTGTLTIVDGTVGSPETLGLTGIGNSSNPVPVITSLSPWGVAIGSSDFTLTVTGANFVSASVIQWNGQNMATTFENGNTLRTTISASNVAALQAAPITVLSPPPDGGISNVLEFIVFRALTLTTKDLIYEHSSRQIYASIPASAPANGSSVIPIDPVANTLGTPVSIGFDPAKLTVSDNGQYLYVSQNFGNSVRRVDIASQTAGLQFSLGSDQSSNQYGVSDMKVLPGSPGTIAVARDFLNMTGNAGVAIYDDGVKRPSDSGQFTGSRVIAFPSPSVLYGVDDLSNISSFRTMSVAAGGVTVTNSTPQLIAGDISFDSGLLYSTSGAVVDPVNRTLAGTFNYSMPPDSTSVVPDPTTNCVFFLFTGAIQAYNRNNFTFLGTLNIPGFSGFTATSLVRWGDNGLAFRTDTQVYLVEIPPSWVTPNVNRKRSQLTSQ